MVVSGLPKQNIFTLRTEVELLDLMVQSKSVQFTVQLGLIVTSSFNKPYNNIH